MILDSPPALLCHYFNIKTVDRSAIFPKWLLKLIFLAPQSGKSLNRILALHGGLNRWLLPT